MQKRRTHNFRFPCYALFVAPLVLLGGALPCSAVSLNVTEGLQLWLDASDSSTLTLDGSEVAQWRDKSGHGHHATPNPDYRPVYHSTGLNGHASLTFNRDRMLINGGIPGINAADPDRTIFFAFTRPNSLDSNSELFGTSTGTMIDVGRTAQDARLRLRDTYSNGGTGGADGGGGISSADDTLPFGPRIVTVFARNDGSTTALADGVTILDTPDSYAHYPLNANLGIGWALFGTRGFIGNLAEVIVYDRVLSYDELQSVGLYLERKYELDTAFKAPEPGTLLLTALAALALVPLYRRRRK